MLRSGMAADDVEAILVRNPARRLGFARPVSNAISDDADIVTADDR